MRNKPSTPQKLSDLPADWRRDLDEKTIEGIDFLIKNNLAFTEQLLKILDRYADEEERREITLASYDNPNWAYAQADRNGARRALQKVRKLFSYILTTEKRQ